MADFLITVIKIVLIALVVLGGVAYMTLAERKVSAFIQWRKGPNRVGFWGLLQPIADGLKFVLKEDFTPPGANKALHTLAPMLVMMPALITYAVIPFGGTLPIFGHQVRMIVADLSIGILFIFAIASLGVYGIAVGGWSSNNKYALLGSLRSSAQMISYEIAMGLSVIPVIMFTGSLRLTDVVAHQGGNPWFVLSQPLSFLLFVVAAFAETNRLPFDLPEAEHELTAGFHTEYGGMKFAMFMLGEYLGLLLISCMITTLFFGGWLGPWLPPIVWFCLKVFVLICFFILLRAAIPRPRYDQLMALGWKVMLPLTLLNLLATGAIALLLEGA